MPADPTPDGAATSHRGARRPRRGRPPGSSGDETTSRVLEAARQHFGDHGYAGARMTAIAKTAGITHSSIYQYFGSKRDLYQAVFDMSLQQLLPRYTEAIVEDLSLRQRIEAIWLASAREYERSPSITAFLASTPVEVRRHPELMLSARSESAALTTGFLGLFESARASGEISAELSDLDLTVAFVGAVMGIGLFAYALPQSDMRASVDILLAAFNGELFDGD